MGTNGETAEGYRVKELKEGRKEGRKEGNARSQKFGGKERDLGSAESFLFLPEQRRTKDGGGGGRSVGFLLAEIGTIKWVSVPTVVLREVAAVYHYCGGGGGASKTIEVHVRGGDRNSGPCILFLKHDGTILRQSSNPVCGLLKSQASSL